ncbi:Hypothetical predicted protein [Octopus vulgaris]|uniref:Uncharacterized protein n=1 Tax=Octopus vulgaris TaxID=6645 RepID=A0AA36F5V9_OCTVU|nr:Hypothetical predicted protein [Octopus vulgaris]
MTALYGIVLIFVHANVLVQVCLSMYICMCVCIYIHTYTHTHTHTHTHAHTHSDIYGSCTHYVLQNLKPLSLCLFFILCYAPYTSLYFIHSVPRSAAPSFSS